jgi:hypothetical protein
VRIDRNLKILNTAPFSAVEQRTGRIQPDGDRGQRHERQRDDGEDDRERQIEHPLHEPRDPRGAKSIREDQPAGLEAVEQNLAGQAFVSRRGVFDANARHLRAQQLFDRQVPAPVGQADHDSIHVAARDNPVDVHRRSQHIVLADHRRLI